MKQNQSYTAEFRTEAVRMVLEQGLSQAEVAARLGVPKGSLANRVWPKPVARSFGPRWCDCAGSWPVPRWSERS